MATVVLSGLPRKARVPQFVILFRRIFKKNGVRSKFWITGLGDMPGSPLKEMTIEFDSLDDALVSQEMLDNYSYYDKSTLEKYILSAVVDVKTGEPSVLDVERPQRPESRRGDRQWEMVSRDKSWGRSRGYSRERHRSRSPIYRIASDLDLELELIRKQRMLIEEQRRLHLERKKLELIQEYGPSAVKEFEAEFREPSNSPPRLRREPKVKSKRKRANFIPRFVLPCKILADEMKPLMDAYSINTDEYMLKNLVILNMRKRMALVLQSKKERVPTKEIVEMYRKVYPKTTDEALVKMAARNIEQSHMVELGNTNQKAKAQDQNVREPSSGKKDEDNTNKATASSSSNLVNYIEADLDVTNKSVVHENEGSDGLEIKVDSTETNDNSTIEAKETESSNTDNVEIEADTTKAIIDAMKDSVNANNDNKEQVIKHDADVDLLEPDVTSSVADDELKCNSDDLEEVFSKDDVEDWAEGPDDWTEN